MRVFLSSHLSGLVVVLLFRRCFFSSGFSLFGRFFPNTQKAKRRQSLVLFLACVVVVLLARALYLRAEKTDTLRAERKREREFLAAAEEEFSRERRD